MILAATAPGAALLLSACTAQPEGIDAKLERAEAAAVKAEAAQKAAERAMQKAMTYSSRPGPDMASEPQIAPDAGNRNDPAADDPNSPRFNNGGNGDTGSAPRGSIG